MRLGIGLLGLLACAFAAPADAGGGRAAVRKTVESSMLVTGSIDIETDGRVGAHSLDQADKLPPAVSELVAKAASRMRFEPVRIDGEVVRARARMGLRVIASKLDDGNYRLRVGSASFGEEKAAEGERVTARKMMPPRYPVSAWTANVNGTVYLVLKIDRKGTVAEVATEQVNLRVIGNEREMEQSRKLLAKASTAAARRWTFNVPTHGEAADKAYWTLRIPVDYRFHDEKEAGYGEWETYVPGPKHHVSWITEEENRQSPEAMIAGGLYPVGSGPRLLTPLTQG